MANTASAKKQARASARRTQRNRSARSAVKTRITRVRRALADGLTQELPELARGAIAGLDRAASKGILHRNNAARRKSRLMRQLNGTATATAAGEAKPATKRAPAAPKKGRAATATTKSAAAGAKRESKTSTSGGRAKR